MHILYNNTSHFDLVIKLISETVKTRNVQTTCYLIYLFIFTEKAALPLHVTDGGEIQLALSQLQGSRRKLPQSPLDDHGGHLPPEAPGTSRASNCSGRERRDRRAVNKAEAITPAATGMWRIICRLVEDDVCCVKWGGRDESNIAGEMESAILDQLICEETDELMQQAVV
jgi:hypothetical protein